MRVIQLNNFEQIHEFGVSWNDLVDSSKDNHIFMTVEWLASWWKFYGANRHFAVLCVEDNGRILAVAPLMKTAYPFFKFKLRMIEFIGTPSSDYHSFIFGEKSQLCARMLLNYINKRMAKWDCMELKDIPENTETVRVLRATSKGPVKLDERKMDLCPSILLPKTYKDYFRKLGRSTRKKLGQWERRLRSDHKVEVKRYDEIGSVETTMMLFFDLHQKRFQAKGFPGLFADETFCDFHLEVAKRFAEKGWLSLYFLMVDDEAVSAAYAFSYKNTRYYYLPGFDPKYSEYGVGNIMTKHLVRISIEQGLREVDLMRGNHPYKSHWNTVIRNNVELSTIRWRPIPKTYNLLSKNKILSSLSKRFRARAENSRSVY